MSTWEKIRNEKISEGYSEDSAYKFATNEMNKRRSDFVLDTILGKPELDLIVATSELKVKKFLK